MRVVQPEGERGSLKWIQKAVASNPDLLQPKAIPDIRWLSPLREDDYAEYRDKSFLRLLGYEHLSDELLEFWPARGPQWDALGVAGDVPVLVEAKAHIPEFLSPASQAGAASQARIAGSFAQVKASLGVAADRDWSQIFYQFANRIAHLWWFHRNGVHAHLHFVDFLNDHEMNGPATPDVWSAAFEVASYALGLPRKHPLCNFIHHVHPDVRQLS